MPILTTLAQVAATRTMLDVACSRCERRGRLSLARLIREMGPDAPVRDAWAGLNADCPKRGALGAGVACDLYGVGLGE